jgi:hypothetical protein
MKKALSLLSSITIAIITYGNPADTIPKATARPLVFENAFLNDPKFEEPTLFASFYTVEVGKIKIETGRLVACDASDMHRTHCFTENFPKGEYPVQLAVIKSDGGEEEYTAYTRILFSARPVKKWAYALKPGEYFREPSDSVSRIKCVFMGDMGMQSTVIADSVSVQQFVKKPHSEWGEVFVDRFKRTKQRAFIHAFNGHNLVSVHTFFNPCYAAYIGYDDLGKPCRLLLDPGNFQIQRSLF